ncbi:MAG: hypothetical protein KBE16_00940 [Alphaproteobacteria bacterium]|nr:hypothetical protein [Alphaproteobacteria bacterium]MBP9878067.1 hypothetical protein [Alphaproteobacteria bacterium]
MNNKISDLPKTDQAATSGPSIEPKFFEHKVATIPSTGNLHDQLSTIDPENQTLLTRVVERTESRHALVITDKTYKRILGNLNRNSQRTGTKVDTTRDRHENALKTIGIQPGQPLPDDFPKRLMTYNFISLKEKQIILKRLEGDLRQKWATQTLKGELNAYQKQLDKEHGIDPSNIKEQKFKAYQEKLAKQELDMRLLFLMIEYANHSESCGLVIARNISSITDYFDLSYTSITELGFTEILGTIFSSPEEEDLLISVLGKATELYQATQKTLQYAPIMAQRDTLSADNQNELLGQLMKNNTSQSDYNSILNSLGIQENKSLPDNLTSKLYENKSLTSDKKKIILDYLKEKLSVSMSLETSIHKINVYDRTLETNPEAQSINSFQTQIAKNYFQENLATVLIEKGISFNSVPLDQYENLRNCKNVQEVRDILIQNNVSPGVANNIAGDIWTILQSSKKIEDYQPPQLDATQKAELTKVFSDPEILKILAFLQTDQTASDRNVIHYEGVKAKPEVIEELISSPEFGEFMTGFESIIFTDDIKSKFDIQIRILGNPDALPADKKNAEKELKAIEEKMIKNASTHLKNIGDKLQVNEKLDINEAKTAQKLTALINVANGKKIATKDMFTIVKHRIIFGIKLAVLSVIAAAAISIIVASVIHLFLPLIAAMTLAIIVTVICSAFGVLGFSIGAFGSEEIREKYEKLMTHLKEMGTNMNVQQTETMAVPLFTKIF